MKNLLIFICIFFSSVSLFFSFLKSTDNKNGTESIIAIADREKIINESLVLKDIKQQIKEQGSKLEQGLMAEMEKSNSLQEEFDLLSEDAKKEKMGQINKDKLQIRDHYNKKAYDLNLIYSDAISSVLKKVEEVLTQVADSEKVDLVFEKNGILYLKNKIDLSDKVLENLNKVMPKFALKTIE